MSRLYDWLNDQIRNPKIIGSRLNDEFDNVYTYITNNAATLDAFAFNGMQINGSMEVSQENGATLVAAPAGYIVDGYKVLKNGTMVVNAQQVADAPTGLEKSLKITVTTAQGSLGSTDYTIIRSHVEGYRVSRLAFGSSGAASLSIGFWIKAHRTGDYSGAVRNSADNRAYAFSFTVSAADTWEYKTVTITGDTTGTWLKTTGIGLTLDLCMAVGSGFVSTPNVWTAASLLGATGSTNGVAATTDTFQITGVLMLPGSELPTSSLSPFAMRPFTTELLLCRRYWRKTYNYSVAPGSVATAGQIVDFTASATASRPFLAWYYEPMRTDPTITAYSPATGTSGKLRNLNNNTDYDAVVYASGEQNSFTYPNTTPSAGDAFAGQFTANARF